MDHPPWKCVIVASVSRKQQLVTMVLTLPSIYAAPQSLELYHLFQYFNISCFIDMHLCVQTQRLILTAASEVELWCKKDFSSFCLPLWDDVSLQPEHSFRQLELWIKLPLYPLY